MQLGNRALRVPTEEGGRVVRAGKVGEGEAFLHESRFCISQAGSSIKIPTNNNNNNNITKKSAFHFYSIYFVIRTKCH
jgi:hypothetical protein